MKIPITLVGNLGSDAKELEHSYVVNVPCKWYKKDQETQPHWVKVFLSKKTISEKQAACLTKGSSVVVVGFLNEPKVYEGKVDLSMNAHTFELMYQKPKAEGETTTAPQDDDIIPF